MISFEQKLHKLTAFEDLTEKPYFLNKINPTVKIIVFFFFIIMLVSVNKYNLEKTLMLTSFIAICLIVSPLKFSTVLKFNLILSPFILMFVIFNPVFDTNTLNFISYNINAGYISAATTLIKFFNTTSISLLLISTTKFFDLSVSLHKLKIPKFMALQLILMYRFIFLFIADILNTVESIKSRSGTANLIKWNNMKLIVSAFFYRAVYRGEEVYTSMLSRGFNLDSLDLEQNICFNDYLFLIVSIGYILILRLI